MLTKLIILLKPEIKLINKLKPKLECKKCYKLICEMWETEDVKDTQGFLRAKEK